MADADTVRVRRARLRIVEGVYVPEVVLETRDYIASLILVHAPVHDKAVSSVSISRRDGSVHGVHTIGGGA